MSIRGLLSAGVFGVCCAAAGIAGLRAQQDAGRTALAEGIARKLFITVTDDKGAAAHDLTPQEVTVKEDGAERTVLTVGPAAETMQIAMLVDDSGAGIQHIREGVAGFLRIVQRTAEVAIVSTAGQNTVVVDFTSDPGALLNGVNRLLPRTTTGGYLLDAIHEAAQTLMRREATRPVIVVLALEGKEFSNLSSAARPRGPAAQPGGGARPQRRQAVDQDDDLLESAADRFHPRSARRDPDTQRRPGGGAAAIRRPHGTARPGDRHSEAPR